MKYIEGDRYVRCSECQSTNIKTVKRGRMKDSFICANCGHKQAIRELCTNCKDRRVWIDITEDSKYY